MVRSLEERLGVRLLNRTTRSVALTEAGERLLADAEPILDAIDKAVDHVNTLRDKPSGALRLNMHRCDPLRLGGPGHLGAHVKLFLASAMQNRWHIRTDDPIWELRFVRRCRRGNPAELRFSVTYLLQEEATALVRSMSASDPSPTS
jgi:DNA-binding transcriptional LysR family regulator